VVLKPNLPSFADDQVTAIVADGEYFLKADNVVFIDVFIEEQFYSIFFVFFAERERWS
jgi:hypothetical protein